MSYYSYYHIIELNNAAVAKMKSGGRELKKAIIYLSQALREYQEHHPRLHDHDHPCFSSSSNKKISNLDDAMTQSHSWSYYKSQKEESIHGGSPAAGGLAGADEHERRMVTNDDGNTDGDETYYMYAHGIFIPPNMDRESIPSAMIFNMGLAHHLYAKQEKEKEEKNLKTAYKLYDLAVQSGMKCNSPLFLMATMNNLGLVHYELNDKDKSIMYFDHLLSMLMFFLSSDTTSSMVPRRRNSNSTSTTRWYQQQQQQEEENWWRHFSSEFLRNVNLVKQHDTLHAAGAA